MPVKEARHDLTPCSFFECSERFVRTPRHQLRSSYASGSASAADSLLPLESLVGSRTHPTANQLLSHGRSAMIMRRLSSDMGSEASDILKDRPQTCPHLHRRTDLRSDGNPRAWQRLLP